jgi:1-acyl-sn-glycerol-3-phosphate acyltransferase
VNDGRLRRLVGRALRRLHWVEAQGLERIPESGNVILAVTHCGVRGGLILESCMQRRVVFVASGRFLRFPVIQQVARMMGAIFISPADILDNRFLDETAEALEHGNLVGVMVQGQQTTGTPGEVKRGAAYLACRLQADVLPISVLKRGLVIRIRVGDLLPRPAEVKGNVMDELMTHVRAQLAIGGTGAT